MDKPYLRNIKSFIMLMGCMLLLAACGPKEEAGQASPSGEKELSFLSAQGGEGIDLVVEKTVFYDAASELKGPYDDLKSDDGKFLGIQFYQGEPVQLWTSAPYSESGEEYVAVYMYRQDGTRETCIERIERTSGLRIAFRDSQGYCYSIFREDPLNDIQSIARLDSSGQVLYKVKIEGDRNDVERICELADGRLAVLVRKSFNYGLFLLDDKGKLTAVELSGLTPGKPCYMGTSEEGLLLVTEERLYRVVLPDGKLEMLFSFVQTVYVVNDYLNPVTTFCLHGDGKLEMLRADTQGRRTCEVLSLDERGRDRQEVVLGVWSLKRNSFLKEQVLKFNSTSEKYQVVLKGPGEGDSLSDYKARIGVELATGKGPDILENVLIESPGSLIEKGMLVDLSPLMKQAGIEEKDYFPMAFDTWRTGDSIYNIRCGNSFTERTIASAVLGDVEDPDIETLVDAMLAYPENAVYETYFSGSQILRELLEGSETLWGMVDWEKGTCDFGGELFRKLLETAKRYRYDARNNYPAICSYRDYDNLQHIYLTPTREESIADGYVPVGRLFDDGAHPVRLGSGVSFSINANAASQEGAWEFLRFLLNEEVQESTLKEFDKLPVKKSAFWAVIEEEMSNGPTEKYGKGMLKPMSRERAEEAAALMENVRALPYKTETILEIVLEESQYYFDGVKEIEQVVDGVDNRVGIYLKERK